MKVIKAMEKMDKIRSKVDKMPWSVEKLFPKEFNINVYEDQVGFGEDYASLEEAREALCWIVDQLGGTILWRTDGNVD